MKNIDVKSLLIGTLLASTIFFAMGATSSTDKWDDKQEWEYGELNIMDDRDDPLYDPLSDLGVYYKLILHHVDTDGTLKTGAMQQKTWPAGWEPFSLIKENNIAGGGGHFVLVRRRIK